MSLESHLLENMIGVFAAYKALADKSFAQLNRDADFHYAPDSESNSIAVIIQHLSRNMVSRWTDFLTTDGEKPWRQRDAEFVDAKETREQLLQSWERGWNVFMDTLHSLKTDDLMKNVMIRGESLSVVQALTRQIAHYALHIGQIIYLAKHLKGEAWRTLSIPKNKSTEHTEGKYLRDLKPDA